MRVPARLRGPVSPDRFLQLAVTAVVALGLVVASGAFVRLTGSGLGCDNWPRCGSTPFPAQDFHAIVEFGNRVVALGGILAALVAWLAARRVAGLAPWVRRTALAAFLGTVAQIPLGGLTVILDLHPLAVMTHFLLALVVVALSVVVALEAWSHARGLGAPVAPRWLRARRASSASSAALRWSSPARSRPPRARTPAPTTPSTGSGSRSRTPCTSTSARPRSSVSASCSSDGSSLRSRREAPGVLRLAGVLLAVLLVQMLVGEIQYRNALPWGLVLVHVTLGAAIWGLTVATAHALWRPPQPLLAHGIRARRAGRRAAAVTLGRIASDDLRIDERPSLRNPVMITAFRGWNDGGQAATVAAGYLARQWEATRFADIDPEAFVDFQAVRPTVSLDEGLTRHIEWPENAFFHGAIPGTERDAVILLGVEPNYRWRAFTDLVIGLARELQVELVVTLGALLADVPHTRPAPVTGAATDPQLVEELGLQLSRYEGPTGIVGVLHDACRTAELRSVSLWSAVPHYVSLAPSPKAAKALCVRLSDLVGVADRDDRARRGRGRVRVAGERGRRLGSGHAGLRRGARAPGRHDRVVQRER